jgi:hypothetical protein
VSAFGLTRSYEDLGAAWDTLSILVTSASHSRSPIIDQDGLLHLVFPSIWDAGVTLGMIIDNLRPNRNEARTDRSEEGYKS